MPERLGANEQENADLDFSGCDNILEVFNALKIMDQKGRSLANSQGQEFTGRALRDLILPLVNTLYRQFEKTHIDPRTFNQQAYEGQLDAWFAQNHITNNGNLRSTLAIILSSAPIARVEIDQQALVEEWTRYDPTQLR